MHKQINFFQPNTSGEEPTKAFNKGKKNQATKTLIFVMWHNYTSHSKNISSKKQTLHFIKQQNENIKHQTSFPTLNHYIYQLEKKNAQNLMESNVCFSFLYSSNLFVFTLNYVSFILILITEPFFLFFPWPKAQVSNHLLIFFLQLQTIY